MENMHQNKRKVVKKINVDCTNKKTKKYLQNMNESDILREL